ncbi:PAS domain-containing protein [Desulfobulbus rhabdoformis]|uniref:HAMP domain-containing sensor histidine kinase n=1 Tax=Desulfobulbus rhabdoformis TaxID=34032 RepID=UPI0019652B56|nr:ATP-binding protein [Desulfobulbus rhabdoformis]MBM9615475.1 PAS domain-containing protein [Desulfobulbus rhabdoformis]
MRNVRLFWQIFPSSIAIIVLCMVITGWMTITSGNKFFYDHLKEDMLERSLLIESTVSKMSQGNPEVFQEFIRQNGRRSGSRITVIDGDGVVLADSNEDYKVMENHGKRPEVMVALGGEPGFSIRFSHTLGESMLYGAIPIALGADQHQGILRMAKAVTPIEKETSSYRQKILGIAFAVLVLAILLSLYAARRISRPLEQMKHGAEQLTKGRIDQLVKIDSEHMSMEMAGLANSINQMADQINRRVRVIIQQRNELEAVFSSMADAVVAIDAEKNIIRMNQAAANLFTLPSEVVKGKAVQGVIRNPYILEMIDFTLNNNSQQEQKVTLFNGAEPVMLEIHSVPLRDEADKSMGALLVMNDLTKLNRLENIRQDFVANVSHELKTPITAIKGYVETLLDGAVDDEDNARRFLNIVIRQANRLDAIVDDLLILSRIEDREGREDVELQVTEVGPLLESVLQTCAVGADEKDIVIEVECDDELYAPINQPLLEQAVINLLNNAIAYSPHGTRITLSCQGSRTVEGEKLVHFSVIDNGPGIAKEHLPRLFERFYRCDRARSRDLGGTGLGLAIVKHIAHAHEGTVEVESTPGKGSTFTITLPRVDAPSTPTASEAV